MQRTAAHIDSATPAVEHLRHVSLYWSACRVGEYSIEQLFELLLIRRAQPQFERHRPMPFVGNVSAFHSILFRHQYRGTATRGDITNRQARVIWQCTPFYGQPLRTQRGEKGFRVT